MLQWVIFVFDDGTKQFVHTGLNAEYYREVGMEYLPGYLYDVERKKYVRICDSCSQVEVRDELPELSLVDRFSFRFI